MKIFYIFSKIMLYLFSLLRNSSILYGLIKFEIELNMKQAIQTKINSCRPQCLGFSLPQTLLMWESSALDLPFFLIMCESSCKPPCKLKKHLLGSNVLLKYQDMLGKIQIKHIIQTQRILAICILWFNFVAALSSSGDIAIIACADSLDHQQLSACILACKLT